MIRVQREDFDIGAEVTRLYAGNGRVGGVCVVVGLVSDFIGDDPDSGTAVKCMTLEHYPGMTEAKLAKIEAEARQRWPLEEVVLIHRIGRLDPGERIVLVATASAHRDAAFDACRFLIDWLKTKAPFWKLEETSSGSQWVDARDSDETAAKRWGEQPTPFV